MIGETRMNFIYELILQIISEIICVVIVGLVSYNVLRYFGYDIEITTVAAMSAGAVTVSFIADWNKKHK